MPLLLLLACAPAPLPDTASGPVACTDETRQADAAAYVAARDAWKADHDACVYDADCAAVRDWTSCLMLAVDRDHDESATSFLADLLRANPCARPEELLLCAAETQIGVCRDCHCEIGGGTTDDTDAHCPE